MTKIQCRCWRVNAFVRCPVVHWLHPFELSTVVHCCPLLSSDCILSKLNSLLPGWDHHPNFRLQLYLWTAIDRNMMMMWWWWWWRRWWWCWWWWWGCWWWWLILVWANGIRWSGQRPTDGLWAKQLLQEKQHDHAHVAQLHIRVQMQLEIQVQIQIWATKWLEEEK